MKLCVFGALGATGRDIVDAAVANGHDVRACDMARDPGNALPAGVEYRRVDVLNDDPAAAVAGCDAVLSALGLAFGPKAAMDPPPLYSDGTRAIIAAMEAAGRPERLIVISATFIATRDRGPVWFRAAANLGLDRIFAQMSEMEHALRASSLDWTAVRPGWLMDGPATGDATVVADVIPQGMIRTRHADLARFMLHCAETGEWSRATPAIARPEPEEKSSLSALFSELLP
ncbi:hypothetical protein EKE94_05820 [Mesobaculum littorinae]|uniref:NAD(P)-binding domain-containing protein n=1 Tax=Mesobaculum littorinae TaxID=2486419 RepID=A0A438AIH4_9RHOB|nr:NAD(P)H-binding protein [Mesobaculum littorinae]RVV98438.1 hypothetical protein EKE94_05820 [Mesobaculum littorinae]